MPLPDPDMFILHSIIYCVLFTLGLVPIALKNPRMMLHSYPKEIQQTVPPKTAEEKRLARFYATPIMLIMIGYPAIVSWCYRPEPVTFLAVFTIMWGLMLVVNIYDLLVLDWLMFCAITPRFVVIKGTESNPGYKNYLFHFVGFLKGILITGTISGVVAGAITLLSGNPPG